MSFNITQIINKFVPVQIAGSAFKEITLQDTSSVVGVGTPFTIDNFKTITLKIAGTSTSRTVAFEVAGFDGIYEPIQGVKVQDLSMSTQATGNNESWQIDVTGFLYFRARIADVSGGDVTIKGRAVA